VNTWTKEEAAILKSILMAGGSYADALKRIPGKSKPSLYSKAAAMGLRSKQSGAGRKVEVVNTDHLVLNKIDHARVRHGLSTYEFSQRAGYNKTQWHLIASGKINPSFKCVLDFARVAKVHIHATE